MSSFPPNPPSKKGDGSPAEYVVLAIVIAFLVIWGLVELTGWAKGLIPPPPANKARQ